MRAFDSVSGHNQGAGNTLTLSGAVSGGELKLTSDKSGSVFLVLEGGGTLESITQTPEDQNADLYAWVNVGGNLTLNKGGDIRGVMTLSDGVSVTLKADMTVGSLFTETLTEGISILNGADSGDVTLKLCGNFTKEVQGALTLGSADKKVNLEVTDTFGSIVTQTFGGTTKIYGDVTVKSGTLTFSGSDNELKGNVTVSGGTLNVTGLKDNTLEGDISITGGKLHFTGGELTLKGNVTSIGTISSDSHQLSAGLDFSSVADVTVEGTLNISEDLVFYGDSNNPHNLSLNKGGTVNGQFLASWGAKIILGDDLVVGYFGGGTQTNGTTAVRFFERLEATEKTVYVLRSDFDIAEGSTTAESTLSDFYKSIQGGDSRGTIGEGVGIGIKPGAGKTVKLTGSYELGTDFKVADGTLELSPGAGAAMTFQKGLAVADGAKLAVTR